MVRACNNYFIPYFICIQKQIRQIILSLVTNRLVFRYYRIQKSQPVVFAMASIGVMFVINAIVRIVIGPNDRNFFETTGENP